MPLLVVYPSGHGFGHATRIIEILRELRRLEPRLDVAIRTAAPRQLFEHGLEQAFDHATVELDVGVLQSDSLTLDLSATLRACRTIVAQRSQLIDREVEALGHGDVVAVLGDVPPLAFDVAERLNVPGIAVANFSWDWIYREYVDELPEFAEVADECARSYGLADELCRLPMTCPMDAFRSAVEVPLIARVATVEAEEVGKRLRLPPGQRLVLLSFGGIGLELADLPAAPPETTFVLPQGSTKTTVPPGYRVVTNDELYALGLRYEDLVAAAAAVMTKPGYGIVAECVANRTPVVYTSRGRFREYPVLCTYLADHAAAVFIEQAALRAGDWQDALASAQAAPWPAPRPAVDGARVIAERIAARI